MEIQISVSRKFTMYWPWGTRQEFKWGVRSTHDSEGRSCKMHWEKSRQLLNVPYLNKTPKHSKLITHKYVVKTYGNNKNWIHHNWYSWGDTNRMGVEMCSQVQCSLLSLWSKWITKPGFHRRAREKGNSGLGLQAQLLNQKALVQICALLPSRCVSLYKILDTSTHIDK